MTWCGQHLARYLACLELRIPDTSLFLIIILCLRLDEEVYGAFIHQLINRCLDLVREACESLLMNDIQKDRMSRDSSWMRKRHPVKVMRQ